MPSITDLVNALSDNVVQKLAEAAYPELKEGKILLGRQHQFENAAPPRIVMIPTAARFGPVDVYSRAPVNSAESRAQRQQRSLATEFVRFEVRCWGAATWAPETNRDEDFDVTQGLYQAVIQAAWETFGPFTTNGVQIEDGDWTDSDLSGAQNLALGRELVFGLVVPTPILDKLFPFAPKGVKPQVTDYLTLPDGTTGQGCES